MVEAGEGGFSRGAGAAEGGVALVDGDVDAALRERDGGGEAVGSGADDVGGLHGAGKEASNVERRDWLDFVVIEDETLEHREILS